jgi:hypothetical protein
VGGRDPASGTARVAAVDSQRRVAGWAAPPGEYVGALVADTWPERVWGCSGGEAPVAGSADPVGDVVRLGELLPRGGGRPTHRAAVHRRPGRTHGGRTTDRGRQHAPRLPGHRSSRSAAALRRLRACETIGSRHNGRHSAQSTDYYMW